MGRPRFGRAGEEGPELFVAKVALEAVPLRGDLLLPAGLPGRGAAVGQHERLDQLGVGQRDAVTVEASEEVVRVRPLRAPRTR